jgi:predicted nuclease of predicted toxin-antitoxin system
MLFLANENVPGAAVAALRAAGQDVVWIRTSAPGSADRDVLSQAAREGRILLTFDKDFGELAKATPLPAACGVVLIRLPMSRPDRIGILLCDILTSRTDWAGHFSVVEPGRIRMRSLTA